MTDVTDVAGGSQVRAVDPRTGEQRDAYAATTERGLEQLVAAAAAARDDGGWQGAPARARALTNLAARLRAQGEPIVARAISETGLSRGRLEGELERTWRQVEAFAALVRSGAHYEATLDSPDPDVRPAPRPDLRRMLVPIGPVAVFAASNFPLAFSVAGGDTASALAAGCPVVCKAHPSHPGTSELVAAEVAAALQGEGLPAGMFGLVQTDSVALATALVCDDAIEAVAFTGSNAAGRAIFDAASARPRPIPVFAEMGSLNPVIVTASALAERGAAIAGALAGAITRDAGQLCTKPGLVLAPAGRAAGELQQALAEAVAEAPATVMLNARLRANAAAKVAELVDHAGVATLAAAAAAAAAGDGDGDAVRGGTVNGGSARGEQLAPAVFTTSAAAIRDAPGLLDERFGPIALIATYEGTDDLLRTLAALPGQLTATLHAQDADAAEVSAVAALLVARVGRLVYNGVPTGVAVTGAMHHGGPYPSTTSAAHTSVGLSAIRRFLRPVVWQNAPQWLLPEPLRDGNPLGVPRMVDGVVEPAPAAA